MERVSLRLLNNQEGLRQNVKIMVPIVSVLEIMTDLTSITSLQHILAAEATSQKSP